MLWRVLQSHDGSLPDDCVVMFANTGKEDEATLRFVRQCGERWGVPITWVEYRNDERGYAIVDFNSASRHGEPFEAIIRKRQYLPNPVTRFCTTELKIRVMHKYLRTFGWREWEQLLGIRADEQRRVAKVRARPSPEVVAETMRVPLADAGVTIHDVDAFWSQQPFKLELPTYNGRTLAGNCDLCFLKGAGQIQSLIVERPARAIWWRDMEALALALASRPDGAVFRKDRPSYAAMMRFAERQDDWVGHDEPISCYCGE